MNFDDNYNKKKHSFGICGDWAIQFYDGIGDEACDNVERRLRKQIVTQANTFMYWPTYREIRKKVKKRTLLT
jgi:hypothetical protein